MAGCHREVIVTLQLVPEGIGNRFAMEFVNHDKHGFLAREKDEGDVAEEYNHECNLANISLPEGLVLVIRMSNLSNVE